MQEIKVFTYDYLVELQRNIEIQEEYSAYLSDSFEYKENYPKGKTGVFISQDFTFKMPDANSSYDLENSILLYENIIGLNPTIASDSRLWTYLTHVRFWDYMKKRWPIDNLEDPKGRIMDRYHLKYLKLESLTRNGIARLWWYVHLTVDENRKDKYELTKILLSRAEIAVGLLERALGSNRNIRIAILEFLLKNDTIRKSENQTRTLYRQMNLLGGVKNLPFLKPSEIQEYLVKIKNSILN